MGTALYVSTMTADISYIFQNISSITVERSARHVWTMKTLMREVIELHKEIIEIKESLKTIMSAILFVKIVNVVIFFAACSLQMEVVCNVKSKIAHNFCQHFWRIFSSQGLKNPQPELYTSFNSVCINILMIYSDCHYSNLVTECTSQVADDAYNCPWYTYTISTKKSIALIIRQSQKSFFYTGLGLMHCTMATFTRVNIIIICVVRINGCSRKHIFNLNSRFESVCYFSSSRPWIRRFHIFCCWKVCER